MRKVLFVLPLVILILSGCVSRFIVHPVDLKNVYVIGKALIDQPIIGGTVRVYDLEGNLLQTAHNETYKTGTFILFFETIPADFRVEVTSGTYEGLPFTGHMYAEVRNLDPKTNAIVVSPVSTLISRYWQEKKTTALPTIERLVKSFLSVEDYIRLVCFYEYNEAHFSPEVFAIRKKEMGGFDSFIMKLLEDLESGIPTSFAAPVSPRGLGSKVLKYAVEQIAAGLIAWGVGEGSGWVLDKIIGGDDGEETKEALEHMAKQLDEIKRALEQLSNQMKEAEKRIVSEIRKNRWEANMSSIQDDLSLIDTMYGRLKILAESDPKKVKEAASLLVEAILDANTGIEKSFRKINAKMIDLWNTEGLLKSWAGNVYEMLDAQHGHKVTENLKVDHVMPFYNEIASFYEYISAYQIKAVNLLIEADHAQDQIYAEYFFNDIYLSTARGKQADLMRAASEYLVSYVEFYTNWRPWITVDPGWQDRNFTRILQECEKILGGLGNYDNLLVIRLMWLSNYQGTNAAKIRPYFDRIRDEGLKFTLFFQKSKTDFGPRTIEAAESVLHLFDSFYTFDDGSKKGNAIGFRTYVLPNLPAASYRHHWYRTVYGDVVIEPADAVVGTEFGVNPINKDYFTEPYAVLIDKNPKGDNQYNTWIVFLYTKEKNY